MTHIAEQIHDRIVQVVYGLPTVRTKAFKDRVYPHNEIPSITVESLTDEMVPEWGIMGSAKVMFRKRLTIEARAAKSDTIGNPLNQIRGEVEAALFADRTLDGIAKDIEKIETETVWTGEGDREVGMITIMVEILYRLDTAAPDSAVA